MEKGPVYEAKARQNKANALSLAQKGAMPEAAEQERLARAAQAIQVTQLRAARARELRRRQETYDALTLTLAPTQTPTLTLALNPKQVRRRVRD